MFLRPGLTIPSLVLLTVFSLSAGSSELSSASTSSVPDPKSKPHQHRFSIDEYRNLPLHFEPNLGQAPPTTKFISRGAGYLVALDPQGMTLLLKRKSSGQRTHDSSMHRIRMKLLGANTSRIRGENSLLGRSNYFVGNNPTKWRTSIRNYASIRYAQLYPGVDLRFYGNQQQLEYDFEVAPGSSTQQIELAFEGASRVRVDDNGDLVLTADNQDLICRRPTIYQWVPTKHGLRSARQFILGAYVMRAGKRVGFKVAAYDTSQALFIDPVLSYATYLGGSQLDTGFGIAVDGAGNAYVTGTTTPTSSIGNDFPTTPGAFKVSCTTTNPCSDDAFVTKLNPAGNGFVYSTYLGGSGTDRGDAIAVDAEGDAYVTGSTTSVDFPVTPRAIQTTFGGGFSDAFVTKLNAAGSALVYSTYLGGSNIDAGTGIALDRFRSVYVVGFTSSNGPDDFPVTPHAYQTTCKLDTFGSCGDVFVSKINRRGSALEYSTYIGGTSFDEGKAIAVDASGNAYITGSTGSIDYPTTPGVFQSHLAGVDDAFITKLNRAGSALEYSTYLGGSQLDEARGIAIDAARNAYVAGITEAALDGTDDFPTTAGSFQPSYGGGFADAFVGKINSRATVLLYSSYLGGSAADEAFGIGVDSTGNSYSTGQTCSTDFPVVNPTQPTNRGDCNAFVTSLNSTGAAAIYSSYFGGSISEEATAIAVTASGKVYFTGESCSLDLPTVNPAQPNPGDNNTCDAFVGSISSSP